ncbi:ran GTPase-activating protein 1-like isoform X2 [Tubulanus polymorphus]|uniref:ran GTPase-activating protein 1-like isoform X2 n=1 Tax=Tubulanus polymorphus TaxID=672921 RepID=UPI003DA22B88
MTTTNDVVENLTAKLAQAAVDDEEKQEEDPRSTELSFAGRGLKLNEEKDAAEIVEAIEKFDRGKLLTLRLEGNTMGIEAARAIAGALEKRPEFRCALWSDMFTGRLKSEIPIALKHLGAAMTAANTHLVELNLSDNAFGPNGVEGFKDLLKSPVCYTLEELYLNNNGLGIAGGTMLARSLVECHERSDGAFALRVFVAGRNRLENDAAAELARAFERIGTLQRVEMPQNGINAPGIRALAAAFDANRRLRVVNLNDNTFTADGARSMARVLPHLVELETLNFGDCLTRTDGALALADALKSGLVKLREIVLSGNEIGQAGGVALAESIENKPALEKLDLSANCFGEAGVELVTGVVEAMDRVDVLQSLSDDEGTDDDDDDEDDEPDEDQSEDEKGDDNDATIDKKDNELNDSIQQINESNLAPLTVANFLKFPTAKKLVALGGDGDEAVAKFRAELGADERDVDRVLGVAVKVASVATDDDSEATRAATRCFDALVSRLLRSTDDSTGESAKNNAVMSFANALLVQIGLLKSEDKTHRPLVDISGVLITLEHAVRQDYFPRSVTEILRVFVGRPHPQLETAGAARDKLLQTLSK